MLLQFLRRKLVLKAKVGEQRSIHIHFADKNKNKVFIFNIYIYIKYDSFFFVTTAFRLEGIVSEHFF